MNENIDLTQILKDCPKGFQLYSPIFGIVFVKSVTPYNVHVSTIREIEAIFRKNGKYFTEYEDSECMLFPSKDQRDWSKFKLKKEKFDPKTLNPFDKILVRRGNENYDVWFPDFVSDPPNDTSNKTFCMCIMEDILMVIPYNDDTKHLVGTNEEAPEFYRYWEE